MRKIERYLLVGIFSIAFSGTLCAYFMPYSFDSKRGIVIFATTCLILFLSFTFCLQRCCFLKISALTFSFFAKAFLIALVFTILIIMTGYRSFPDRYLFVLTSKLEINPNYEALWAHEQRNVKIIQFDSGISQSFSSFQNQDNWKKEEDGLSTDGNDVLIWEGKTFRKIELVFQAGPDQGNVEIKINGESFFLDLLEDVSEQKAIQIPIKTPIINRIFFVGCYGLSIFLLLFLILTASRPQHHFAQEKITAWYQYTPIMGITWTLFLFTFFPGLLSPDSTHLWIQSLTGIINDVHPHFMPW